METKHTELALPWHISQDGCSIDDVDSTGVCAMYADERSDAKRNLIVRACNSHDTQNKALIGLVAFIEKHKAALVGDECTWQEYEEIVEPAIAAIALAEKET